MYELAITDHFASAHYLREYDGPCENLHGHTWKVQVSLRSAELNELGLVVDFRDIKAKLKEFLAQLDHVCLNDLPAFKNQNPSTENMARYICQEFSQKSAPFNVHAVTVWESDNACVTYYNDISEQATA